MLKELPSEMVLSLPNILSRPVVIANHFLKLIGKDRTPEYRKVLTTLFEDPKKFAKILEGDDTLEKQVATTVLKELGIMGSTSTIAESQRGE